MSYNDAKRILLSKYSDSIVTFSYKTPDGYVFCIKPKGWDDNKILIDPYFKVLNTGKIIEWNPVMNIEEYKKYSKNPIEGE